jgi:hypothetical protein
MPLTPVQSGQLNPGSSTFFGSSLVAATGVNISPMSGIYIPFSALESYKIGTSGDVRELLYSIVDKINTGLTTMGINTSSNKVSTTSSISFLDANSVRKSYAMNMDLNVTGMTYDVKDET